MVSPAARVIDAPWNVCLLPPLRCRLLPELLQMLPCLHQLLLFLLLLPLPLLLVQPELLQRLSLPPPLLLLVAMQSIVASTAPQPAAHYRKARQWACADWRTDSLQILPQRLASSLLCRVCLHRQLT